MRQKNAKIREERRIEKLKLYAIESGFVQNGDKKYYNDFIPRI